MSTPKCGAMNRAGKPCGRAAGHGTDHLGWGRCSSHTGSTPNGRQAAAVAHARFEAGRLGAPMADLEPHDALVLAYQIKAGEVSFYSGKIAELNDSQLAGHPTSRRSKDGEVEERQHTPQLNLWIQARDAATRDMVSFAKAAADAGVDERRLRITERYAEPLAALVNVVMRDLLAAGMDAHFADLALDSFRSNVGVLDGTATPVLEAGEGA